MITKDSLHVRKSVTNIKDYANQKGLRLSFDSHEKQFYFRLFDKRFSKKKMLKQFTGSWDAPMHTEQNFDMVLEGVHKYLLDYRKV